MAAWPALTMDPQGRILHSNMALTGLLAHTALIRVRDGHLTLPEPLRAQLASEIATLRAAPHAARRADAPPYRAVRLAALAGEGEDALYAFYHLIRAGVEMPEIFVKVSFYRPAAAPDVDLDLLAGAFDLTPAESRVAAHIAAGRSPKEIAARLNVQHDTVRKQLQSVYQKTGTNRQQDLIRLLLHLPPRPPAY